MLDLRTIQKLKGRFVSSAPSYSCPLGRFLSRLCSSVNS